MINIAKKVNRLQNSSMIISTRETQHTGQPQRSPGKLAQETRVHWVNLLVGIGSIIRARRVLPKLILALTLLCGPDSEAKMNVILSQNAS